MKRINIREFRMNMTSCLNDLPVMLTRNGKDVAEIKRASDLKEASVYTKEKENKNVYTNLCKHGSMKGLCKHGCK